LAVEVEDASTLPMAVKRQTARRLRFLTAQVVTLAQELEQKLLAQAKARYIKKQVRRRRRSGASPAQQMWNAVAPRNG
jgi:hypothetical protein